jgi:hypothetical protein
MPSVIKSVSFDAVDALALARFWAAALGSDVDEDSTTDKAFVEAAGWGGPNIWFTRVPEHKVAKNRVHFDLRAPGSVAAQGLGIVAWCPVDGLMPVPFVLAPLPVGGTAIWAAPDRSFGEALCCFGGPDPAIGWWPQD